MQKNRKIISFGNFCSFFEVFTETLEQNIRKSNKKCFLDGKKTNKEKLEILKFLRDSVLSQGQPIAFDKIGGNYVLSANSIKISLLGYICMQNSYLQ